MKAKTHQRQNGPDTAEFVTVKRLKTENLHGFVLAESKKLLALHCLRDFQPDGIMVLDKRYITDVNSSDANRFQLQLMRQFDVLPALPNLPLDLKNWHCFFNSIVGRQPFCLLEEEYSGYDLSYIGKIDKIKKQALVMHEFSGKGRWYQRKTKVFYDWISLCHINSRYVSLFERYFRTQGVC